MRRIRACAGALLISTVAATTGWAADEAATVRVALIDISSAMPTGMMGYGMMGPGMMGQAPGSTTPGGSYGMMGGMMGHGMMMGMMSIRTDKPTVKAGTVTFDVTNWSRSVLHEMLIVPVDSPNAPLPYDYARAQVPEEQVKVLGEAEDIQPSKSKTLEITLPQGSYLLICNLPGHYAAGMVAPLSVTP
ncbi:hypothetical protein FZ934_23995 (plasmid) [Rhizobium grahamii]|uniref:Blue (type 1) copper domain-containing protein n=1 Tax=Rhizobium grahamii TaxID=1120045 RepID=A0A5Q0CBX0_9HYPH|nr:MULTISPECIES: hypothetical protein [Rhizobium]QFY63346.1 hypothetical protein FZ934_23995 [Rhizobium grahamii]QRM51891.1 hypothetical protein F3Y33_21655 [Rhizobium sp. BG6]